MSPHRRHHRHRRVPELAQHGELEIAVPLALAAPTTVARHRDRAGDDEVHARQVLERHVLGPAPHLRQCRRRGELFRRNLRWVELLEPAAQPRRGNEDRDPALERQQAHGALRRVGIDLDSFGLPEERMIEETRGSLFGPGEVGDPSMRRKRKAGDAFGPQLVPYGLARVGLVFEAAVHRQYLTLA